MSGRMFLGVVVFLMSAVAFAADSISWVPWTDGIFERAKQENKFVILDLHAVWCHWCHVMDETTYKDPKVIQLLSSKYIAVSVDQDSRPDLANKYEDYGWPATIVFSPTGQELVKRSGYIQPERMASMLQAVIDDPTPGPSVTKEEKLEVAANAPLDAKARKKLGREYLTDYDKKAGGWGFGHKYLQADSLEWALREAKHGDKVSAKRAKETLQKARGLWDRAWGGAYQYSVEGDWKEPHFEKILSVQCDFIRSYALGYALWHDPEHLEVARSVAKYLAAFLTSPDGTFYVSQDADLVPGQHSGEFFALNDAERRKKGIPRVDTHVYARENGWAADALTQLAMASGDPAPLAQATRAVNWILKHRAVDGGGFRHNEEEGGRLFLGDSLAMGQATLRLYLATGDRSWLAPAKAAAAFIAGHFTYTDGSGKTGGFVTAAGGKDAVPLVPQRDENVGVARFGNLLYQVTGEKADRDLAETAMRYLGSAKSLKAFPAASVLLADAELGSDPLHVTVVGPKKSTAALALFQQAVGYPDNYKRVEWWDKGEGNLPRNDVTYPELEQPAAFICTGNRCSQPVVDPAQLNAKIDAITKKAR